jgi:glycosyltransferase involved in cell wall biosynthesis
MHTDPMDQEGPNLFKVSECFNVVQNVMFSTDRVGFDQMNVLHNVADFYINISCQEGFGIGSLEAMMTNTPIIVQKTGGMTKQVLRDDGSYNGIGLDPEVRNLVGSQAIPYIFEDHVSNETVANAIMQMYEWGPEKRKEKGRQALEYARTTFSYNKMIQDWDNTLWDCIHNWKERRQRWTCKTL